MKEFKLNIFRLHTTDFSIMDFTFITMPLWGYAIGLCVLLSATGCNKKKDTQPETTQSPTTTAPTYTNTYKVIIEAKDLNASNTLLQGKFHLIQYKPNFTDTVTYRDSSINMISPYVYQGSNLKVEWLLQADSKNLVGIKYNLTMKSALPTGTVDNNDSLLIRGYRNDTLRFSKYVVGQASNTLDLIN
jgi:hypothetical protein